MILEKRFRVLRASISLSILLSLFCSGAFAVGFHEMPVWDPDVKYRRGSVVSHKTDIYISILPKKGISPGSNKVAWRQVKYNKHNALRPHKLYLLGAVVAHDGKYYISKKINVPRGVSSLNNGHRWLEFTHPAMGFNLPEDTEYSEEMRTLVGIDTNGNGIRDDYEEKIIMSDLPAPVKTAALGAGVAYGNLIVTGAGAEASSETEAGAILQGMVLAKLCQRQFSRQTSGKTWSESAYFDTLDRVEAKYKLQSALARMIDQRSFSIPEGDPCEQLVSSTVKVVGQ
ncbi:MAG: hypothetical protein OXC07_07915 [Kistimonas sp.]|nr:hypothetical protein [Kistimonas sp.]